MSSGPRQTLARFGARSALETAWDSLACGSTGRGAARAQEAVVVTCVRLARSHAATWGLGAADGDDIGLEVVAQSVRQGWVARAGRDQAGVARDKMIVAWLGRTIRRRVQRRAQRRGEQPASVGVPGRPGDGASGVDRLPGALAGAVAPSAVASLRRALERLARGAAAWRFDGPGAARARAAMVVTLLGCFDREAGLVAIDDQISARCGGAAKGGDAWKRAQSSLYKAEARVSAELLAFANLLEQGVFTSPRLRPPPPLTTWLGLVQRIGRGLR